MSNKSRKTYKAELVKEVLEQYPNATTRSLAKILSEKYPLDFTFISARSLIKYYRGEKDNSNQCSTKTYFTTMEERKQRMGWNKLPKSDYQEQEAFVMPKGNNRVLLLSDIHLPYHDEQALSIALEWGYNKNPNAIILNGDTIDMYQASRFTKDRRLRDLAGELEITRDFLKQLKEEFSCPIYFKLGNHEDRWENYLKTVAPELLGIGDFELQNVLRFGELGITEIKSKQSVKLGDLTVLHGHEFGHSVFSPVNAARGLYMRSKVNSIVGHHHQTSEHSEKDLNGNVVTTWSMGCLCGLMPEYMPHNKFNHGFAYVETEASGEFEVNNLRIIEGRVR